MKVGFYLGHLRGRSFPPPQKERPASPKKILLSLQYISNYIGKIRDEVSAHIETFLKIVPQNAPDCISGHIHFKKISRGPGKLVAFGHSGLLPQRINPR